MKSILLFLITILLAGFIFGCGSEQSKSEKIDAPAVLKIGVDPSFPPFESIDSASGLMIGFDIDLIHELCEMNKWEYELIAIPFDQILTALVQKRCDIVISAVTITPEREAELIFSEPYFTTGQILAVTIENETILSIADLKGKQVGVQQGTTAEKIAKKMAGVQVYSYKTINSAFSELESNILDAVLNDLPSTEIEIIKSGKLKRVGDIISTERYGIALRKSDHEMVLKINQSLEKFKNDKGFQAIFAKWSIPLDLAIETKYLADTLETNKEE